MEYEEFAAWTEGQVELGRMDPEQREQLLRSRQLFDADEDREVGLVIGYLGDERFASESVADLFAQVRLVRAETDTREILYFEPIGHNPFGA